MQQKENQNCDIGQSHGELWNIYAPSELCCFGKICLSFNQSLMWAVREGHSLEQSDSLQLRPTLNQMTAVTIEASLKVDQSSASPQAYQQTHRHTYTSLFPFFPLYRRHLLSQPNLLFIRFALSSFFKLFFHMSSFLNIRNGLYIFKIFKENLTYLHFLLQSQPFVRIKYKTKLLQDL